MVNAPKLTKGSAVSHEHIGNGYVTALLGVAVYVAVSGRKMPCGFLVRDVQWSEALKCWTLKDNYEKLD